MRPVYRRPEPAFYWASPNVEADPISGEPYYYYRGVPQDWGYGKYEGGPYWYRHRPAEDGFLYYGPKYEDQGRRYYERNGSDFGGDFSRNFRPVYVYPPPTPAAASGPFGFRPFHPGDQFRHPDEYPMRFVPVTYGSAGPWEIEHAKQHCCACPNHVCHPETSPVKGFERKGLMDDDSEKDQKAKLQNMQELTGPVMWFNPSEWWNRASESRDRNEEKGNGKGQPVYWIPANCNKNDGYKEQERQFPGHWIPLGSNYRPQGGDEEKNKCPGYWIPLDLARPRGKEENKNHSFEGKSQPFPVLWIPDGNLKETNSQEETKNESLEKEHKKINEAESRHVIVQDGRKEDKQMPVEGVKDTKVRDIPVKQLEGGKSAQAQKRDKNVADNHGKSAQAQKREENDGVNHTVSSPKASKLPPVCLRVDPLPGKKKSNGKSSSRSPSPPRKEENMKDNASSESAGIGTSNAPVEKNVKPNASKVSAEIKEVEENANLNASKVASEAKKADENGGLKTLKLTSEGKNADVKSPNEAKKVDEDLNVQRQQDVFKKTELSTDQAALKIQAFYRGCLVRKREPLRKLREIAKISKHVEELKQQIRSSEFVGELRRDNKTKGKMSEFLMALLLQLDTIQGLHPVVRDVRKSVARELVQLQEKLDALVEEAHIGISQPCARDTTENNVTAVQEKIDDIGKDLEATEESCKTPLNTSSENQQVDGENVLEKETLERESLETGNEVNDDGKENMFVEKEGNDSEEETENATTKYGENVQDNAPVQQEALEVSYDQEIPSLTMHLQKAETENQNENVVNEIELEVPLQNIITEKEEKWDPAIENLFVEKEEKLRMKHGKPDPALPGEIDADVEEEICPASTLDQEQEVAASDNSNTMDENANALDKIATLEFRGRVVVTEPEVEPDNKINTGYAKVSGFEENKTESEETQNALPGKTREDGKFELNMEVDSQTISDSLSGTASEGINEINLNKMENAIPAAENMGEKGDFAAANAQGTDDTIVEKSAENPITGDGLSTMNTEKDQSIPNCEEHAPKCSGPSDDSGVSNMVDLAQSENINESKANIAKYVKNQDHEKWKEENEKLKEMVEKLVEAEKNQMATIAQLNEKIMQLENKLSKGKGMRKARVGQLRLRSNRGARNSKNATALGC